MLLGLVVFLALHPLLGVALATGVYYRFADRIAEVRAALADDPTPEDPGLAEDSKEGDGDAPPPTRLAKLRETAFGTLAPLALRAKGLHADARARLDREAATLAGTRFELVVIDHGFHTDVPDAFRLTFCKTWAAVGLRDANLLAEAAFELGLSDDPACLGDGEVLPLFLALLPFDAWDAGRFPSPLELVRSLRDSERGLRKLRGATGRMPKIMHVLMRANRQLLSLFQLQYGLSPQMRYEFMKTMTTHALLGLRRENPRDALPDPAALRTADATFFEAELPGVKARVRRDFSWRFPSLAASATAGEVKRLVNKGLKRMAAGKWDFSFDDDD